MAPAPGPTGSPARPRRFGRRVDPALTPEQREARIAELRARRRARLRWLGVRAVLLAGALTLALVLLGYWLLSTIGGREFLLAQIVARLPANAALSWQRAEGPASGPLTLRGVRFSYDALVFTAARVTLDPALGPLLGRRLRLDALQVEGATLDLPPSADEPFELPRWPDSLPQIAPPLALQADDVQVDGLVVTREGAPLIDIRQLRGGLLADAGTLHLERLRLDSDRGRFTAHGDYEPGNQYRSDLVATAVLPAAAGRTPARLGLVVSGDLSRMDVAIAGRAPMPLQATLVLRGDGSGLSAATSTAPRPGAATARQAVINPAGIGRHRPHWQLRAATEGLDLGLLTDPRAPASDTPLALQVQVDGIGGDARLQGAFRQGDFQARVLNSRVRIEEQVLRLDPLDLQVFEGRVVARGTADFREPRNGRFRFAINARDLEWGGTSAAARGAGAGTAPVIGARADIGLAGTTHAWAVVGRAGFTRDSEQASVELDGRGSGERITLRTLRARMPTGTLDATGTIAWAPALDWNLDATLAGFDPGYFVAGWDGMVNGRLATTGRTRADGGLDIAAEVPEVGGRLRGRPLAGSGRFRMTGAATAADIARYEGEAALTLGGSRIDARGSLGEQVRLDARMAPLQLADLLPDTAGSLRGSLRMTGPRATPDISADLEGSGLRYGNYAARSLSLRGELPWRRGNGTFRVAATGVEAGLALDSVEIEARGAVENLQLEARTRSELGTLSLRGHASRRGDTWQGALAELQLQPTRGASWTLQQPAEFRWTSTAGGGRGNLADSCLASSAGGALCASADWPRRGVAISGQGLPLALAAPYLPAREGDQAWLLTGEFALDANLRPLGNGWEGRARIHSASGGFRNSERARRDVVGYQNLELDATFRPQGIEAQFGTDINDEGRIDARVTTGWDAYAPIDGELRFNLNDLRWAEMFSPDIVEPTGRLSGGLRVRGTRAEPQLGGRAQLQDFHADLPALAIALDQGNLTLGARPDGSARISGSVRTVSAAGNPGGGVLDIDGTLGWQGEAVPLVLNLSGENLLVSDSLDLHLVASPDLQFTYKAGDPMRLTGKVGVPEARIDLERLDQSVSASPDVVVLDPADPDEGGNSPLDMDLAIALGDKVTMNGFGLEGRLGGGMRVRARPGREMTATGILDVAGKYEAYGQDLRITRGQLSWSNDPVSDPVITLRAERVIGDVTAGIDVSGRASRPQAEVWSNPASSQPDALAYLTLGRPLSGISGAERDQLDAASAALTAGGSLLASQLGSRIGLDDAGMMDSRALGGSVFGVGKYLSPRLYVGYGVSLLGTGQVLTLKYLLGRGFDIEIESSTLENRGSLNWRTER